MERETYRLNLERILADFPKEPVLSMAQIVKYLHNDRTTLKRNKEFMKLCRLVGNRAYMSRENLAHWMAGQ